MARITLNGGDYEIPPLSIEALEEVAPSIDALIAVDMTALRATNKIADMIEPAKLSLAILGVGLRQIDPTWNDAAIRRAVKFTDLPAVNACVNALLVESGLLAGNVQAPKLAEDPPA